MMAARRTAGALGERAGVIVDRSRPLVPLSAIPEDLIAQAQVNCIDFRIVIIFGFWKYYVSLHENNIIPLDQLEVENVLM